MTEEPKKPSEISDELSGFDSFAESASKIASRAPFFAFCVLLIVLWAPSIAFLKLDTWQLIINTLTTIITFLMVALLQNSQMRADQAVQRKLNAIADGLADLMQALADDSNNQLNRDKDELRSAVGLELRESA